MVAPELMSGVDAAWLHMDRPENTADVVALIGFADRVPFSEVSRLVEERLVPHARFVERIRHEGPLSLATWEPDPGFALSRHLHRTALNGRFWPALDRFAGEVASERLDPEHPLWRAWVVHGAAGGSAIVAKLHHCIADGFALVGLLLSLADEVVDAGPGLRHRMPAYRDLRLQGGLTAALREALGDRARAAALAGAGLDFVRSVARMAALAPDPPSVLSRPLSGRRRMAWSRPLPLADLRSLARGLGVTVNDLVLAALSGALRSHLADRGEDVGRLPVRALVPVNLRTLLPAQLDGALGNCFGLVFLELPIPLEDPRARLLAVRDRVAELKRSPDAVATYGVLSAIGHLPALLENLVTSFFSAKASLVVTNVPGPHLPLHLAGHEVRRIQFCVPHPARLGLGVSILSYAGELRLGARADVAVMPSPGDLLRRIPAEIEALRPLPRA
jgi:diacylglycerol O-acyltransferase